MNDAERLLIPGVLIAAMIVCSSMTGVWGDFPAWPAGVAGWAAACLLWRRLPFAQRLQSLILIGIGVAGLLWGALDHGSVPLAQTLSQNHALLSMITAVSFLRLVSIPRPGVGDALPVGRKAFVQTLLGAHFLGGVINISAVMIIGDRLARARGQLGRPCGRLLSRSFSAAALWSPFFAAMATVLVYSPGAEFSRLLIAGAPLAAWAMAYTYLAAEIRDDLDNFYGYPIRRESLFVPAVLAIAVFSTHLLWPQWSVLTVIMMVAPGLTVIVLTARTGVRGAGFMLWEHVGGRLPTMGSELSLFLAAGVLAVGLTEALASLGAWTPFEVLNANTATLTLVVVVALAALGLHPVISIATIGAALAPLDPDPNLLATVFLMGWGVGVTASPLSGIHLILQGRYHLSATRLAQGNWLYVLTMLGLCAVVLQIYERLG